MVEALTEEVLRALKDQPVRFVALTTSEGVFYLCTQQRSLPFRVWKVMSILLVKHLDETYQTIYRRYVLAPKFFNVPFAGDAAAAAIAAATAEARPECFQAGRNFVVEIKLESSDIQLVSGVLPVSEEEGQTALRLVSKYKNWKPELIRVCNDKTELYK
jgi:hypothetical protein